MGSQKQDQTFKIEGSMTVTDAASLREALINHCETSGGFNLDLSSVETCDIAGVQLLISTQKSAESSGKALVYSGISDAVKNAFSRAGIDSDKFLKDIEEV